MKTLFRNKKMMTGVITVMVGITILLACIAYAWFFGASGNFDEKFEIGDMEAEADFAMAEKVLTRPILPGDLEQGIGEISIPAGVKMNLENSMIVRISAGASEIIAKDGTTLLDPSVITFGVKEEGRVDKCLTCKGTGIAKGVTCTKCAGEGFIGKAWPLGMWINVKDVDDGTGVMVPDYDNAKIYTWMKGDDGDIYVEMMGDDTLHYAYEIEASGTWMDNTYRGATVTLGNGVYWIQSRNLEKALKETQVDKIHDTANGGDGCLPKDYFPGLAAFIANPANDDILDFFEIYDEYYIDIHHPENNWPRDINDDPIKILGPELFGSRLDLQKLFNVLPDGSITKAYLAKVIG